MMEYYSAIKTSETLIDQMDRSQKQFVYERAMRKRLHTTLSHSHEVLEHVNLIWGRKIIVNPSGGGVGKSMRKSRGGEW